MENNQIVKTKNPIQLYDGFQPCDLISMLRNYISKIIGGADFMIDTALLILFTLISTRLLAPIRLMITDTQEIHAPHLLKCCLSLVQNTDYLEADEVVRSRKSQDWTKSMCTLIVRESMQLYTKHEKRKIMQYLSQSTSGCIAFSNSISADEFSTSFLRLNIDPVYDFSNSVLSTIIDKKSEMYGNVIRNSFSAIDGVRVEANFLEQALISMNPEISESWIMKNLEQILRVIVMINDASNNANLLQDAIIAKGSLTEIKRFSEKDIPEIQVTEKDYKDLYKIVNRKFLVGDDALPDLCRRVYEIVETINREKIINNSFVSASEDSAEIRKLLKKPDSHFAWVSKEEIINKAREDGEKASDEDIIKNLRTLRDNNFLSIQKHPSDQREDIYAVAAKAPKCTLELTPPEQIDFQGGMLVKQDSK